MAILVQLLLLSAVALHASRAAPVPGYPGAYHGGAFNNGAYNNGAFYNGAYNNGAYNNGAYNAVYNNGAYNNGAYNGGFDAYPAQYNFDYRVAEPRTGDYKNHQESRNGDAVRGQYSVAEPDGSLLTVRYAADDAHGYTAVVERSGAGGTVVQNFPGPAPLAVGAPGYVAPVGNPAYVAPVVAPGAAAAVAAANAAAAHNAAHGAAGYVAPHGGAYGPAGGHGGAYRPFGAGYHPGFGTSSTTFHGPHAAYSYTN